jgi:hypothetical protein
MKYFIYTDKKGYVEAYGPIQFNEDAFEYNIQDNILEDFQLNFPSYKLIDGVLTKDDTRKKEISDNNDKFTRINELKFLLEASDYKVTKCYEAKLLEKPMPYDLIALVSQRQSWRDEINELEGTSE